MKTFLSVLLAVVLSAPGFAQEAFPGAVGFGANATGWRGGAVIKITNTNDSGPGSFRACLETNGPRVCIPTLGGTIEVESSIQTKGDLYVAGQAAPADSGGLQVRLNPTTNTSASPVVIIDADSVMMRHLRFRPGPGLVSTSGVDALTIQDSQNIMIANMSLAYSTDELFNVDADNRTVRDITLQDSILVFALEGANHPDGDHSKAILLCSTRATNTAAGRRCGNITIAKNLLAHNKDRNPDFEASGGELGDDLFLPVEAWNNYIYNPGSEVFELHEGNGVTSAAVIMNNLMVAGSDTTSNIPMIRVADDLNDQGQVGEIEYKVYARGNIDPFFRTTRAGAEDLSFDATERDTILNRPDGVSSGPHYAAEDLQAIIPDTAGARLPALDVLDTNTTNQARNGSGGSDKDDPSQITGAGLTGGYPTPAAGTPETDTDGDGMPDAYEIAAFGGSFWVTRFNPWGDNDGNGWSNLEDYLNCRSGDISGPC